MRPPTALSIAGTDPSGGAGLQADLKTFTARGVYGASVATVLVAQNTHGVRSIYPVDTSFVAEQLASVTDDMELDATKTGMLSSADIVELVADRAAQGGLGFLVVDPVMVASSGHRLIEPPAVEALRELLLPRADLVTPNLPEGALLLGEGVPEARSLAEMREQALALVERGPRAVLLKGGHLPSGDIVDVLAVRGGSLTELPSPRVDTPNTHGTGCTLSSAIAADYARLSHEGEDEPLGAAVRGGQAFLHRALAGAAEWRLSRDPEGAHGPVNHVIDL